MAERELMNWQERIGSFAVKSVLAMVCLFVVLYVGGFLYLFFFESRSPEESVQLARERLKGYLVDIDSARRLENAKCKYVAATYDEPAWVGCKIAEPEELDVIYFTAFLTQLGTIEATDFQRVKR
jgi:hypothetical protein